MSRTWGVNGEFLVFRAIRNQEEIGADGKLVSYR
jgi:hypothetical protein